MAEGWAYVFLRRDGAPLPPGCAGHVGWGFTWDDVVAFCGSTENRNGSPLIAPGGDNDAWIERVESSDQMFDVFRRRNYHALKFEKVEKRWPDNALGKAKEVSGSGYAAIGNNCLDHTFRVLQAYGVQDLPWPATHPSPNDWFAVFNGELKHL